MKIVVLDGNTLNPGDNPWTEVSALGEFCLHDRTPDDQVVARAADADIVITNKAKMPAAVLAALPRLKFIAVTATGYNVVDVAAARQHNIPVSNVPAYAGDSVAQFVFALLLEMCHRAAMHDQLVKSGEWGRTGEFCFWRSDLVELSGKTMGIVGFGEIGRRVGELAHAFGMNVLACDVADAKAPRYKPFAFAPLPELFAQADVVSLHCPLTNQNAGMVNRDLLGRMKPTAFLINTARGGLVNEADLAAALNGRTLAAAALDVVSTEPISPTNPLLQARNCLITPHIAWATLAARQRLMNVTARNVAAFIKGRPINVVN